jgi:hypothetical protein
MLLYKIHTLIDGSAEPGIVPDVKSQTGTAYLSKAKIAYHIFYGAGHPGTVLDYTLHNRISKSAYLIHKPNISVIFSPQRYTPRLMGENKRDIRGYGVTKSDI